MVSLITAYRAVVDAVSRHAERDAVTMVLDHAVIDQISAEGGVGVQIQGSLHGYGLESAAGQMASVYHGDDTGLSGVDIGFHHNAVIQMKVPVSQVQPPDGVVAVDRGGIYKPEIGIALDG